MDASPRNLTLSSDPRTTTSGVYEALFKASLDAMLVCDDTGRYLDCNPAALELTGYERNELLAMCVADLSPPAQREQANAAWEHFLEQGRQEGRFTICRKDGAEVVTEFRAVANAAPGVHLSILRDITRRLNAIDEAARSAELLQDFVENAAIGLHWETPDGQILWANQADIDLLGYTRDEYVGHNIKEFHADPEAAEDILGRLERHDVIRNYEARLRTKDGSIRHVLINSNVRRENGEFIHTRCFTRDITERKQEEEELRSFAIELDREVQERTRELRSALQELEGFTQIVSHDLRSPLRAISATASILREDFAEALPPEGQRLLSVQSKAAGKASELLDDLLDMSRGTGKPITKSEVDVTELARTVAAELTGVNNGTFQFQIQEGLTARADESLLRLVLQNLFENAMKFSPEGGKIELGRDNEAKAFYVKDSGVGFEPSKADTLFEVFTRLHAEGEYSGTGLGLANVRRVVERHGGKVWAHSDGPGKGSTFCFSLE